MFETIHPARYKQIRFAVFSILFAALMSAALSARDSIRLGAWHTLAFFLLKDLVVAILVIYFFYVARATEDASRREWAMRAILWPLATSLCVDSVIMLLTFHFSGA